MAEIRKLFNVQWKDDRYRLANLLACLTGMRAGEIAALQLSYLSIDGDKGIITITHSYEYSQQILKGTKTDKPQVNAERNGHFL